MRKIIQSYPLLASTNRILRWHQLPVYVAILGILCSWISLPRVHALQFDSDVAVTIASSSVDFTVRAVSYADRLVVNATSVQVDMSSSTNGTFTLSSTSTEVSVATSTGSGGSFAHSCDSDGTAQVIITQDTASSTWIITPGSSQCAYSPSPTGVGYALLPKPKPVATPLVVLTTSTTQVSPSVPQEPTGKLSIQEQIAVLLAQVQKLQAQLATQGGVSAPVSKFARDLTVGSRGDDVRALQEQLVAQGYLDVMPTGYFGELTKAALREYQKTKGISPAAGYFGPKTRAAIE